MYVCMYVGMYVGMYVNNNSQNNKKSSYMDYHHYAFISILAITSSHPSEKPEQNPFLPDI